MNDKKLVISRYKGDTELTIYKDMSTNELMIAVRDEQNLLTKAGKVSSEDFKRIIEQFDKVINEFK